MTDVDDKTIRGATEKKMDLREYTRKYKTAFFHDLNTLSVHPAEYYPEATHYIEEMIKMIEGLLKKGYAYRGDSGDVFYKIHRFPSYGKLSHLRLDQLRIGGSQRIAEDDYQKESAADFVLWKRHLPQRDGEIFWESPFGRGRPGWHIECSAMAFALLGESIDIHVGGVDNMFPHHENEIAQSEGFSGKPFVRYWMHIEHLMVEGCKMSKSLGNVYTLSDLLDRGYSGLEIRYLLLSTHYRTSLNFKMRELDRARHSLRRIHSFIERMERTEGKTIGSLSPYLEKMRQTFREFLGDDLNISGALSVLFDLIREVNAWCDQGSIGKSGGEKVLTFLDELNRVLAIMPRKKKKELTVPPEVKEAFIKRQQARLERRWEEADRYRERISFYGYSIEDGPEGSRLKKNSS